MSLVLEHVKAPTDDARILIAELDAELSGPFIAEQRHGLSIARVFEPGVVFFIARLDGEPVGCGGVAFDDGYAEVKRMYVRPSWRGRKVASTILARLEQEARDRDIRRIVLETGDVLYTAIRFYERAGFKRCASFGAYSTMPPPAVERSVFFWEIDWVTLLNVWRSHR